MNSDECLRLCGDTGAVAPNVSQLRRESENAEDSVWVLGGFLRFNHFVLGRSAGIKSAGRFFLIIFFLHFLRN